MNSKTHPIYVVGDSHVDVFSGFNYIQPEWPKRSKNKIPLFKTARLGAVLAFNISNNNHPTHKKLLKFVSGLPKHSRIMLVAGEVDCRVHLVKQARLQNRSIESISRLCAEKYFGLVLELSKKGFVVLVCAPVPTTPFSIRDLEYPTVGSYEERNTATNAFNKTLKKLCKHYNVHFVSIYGKLLTGKKVNQKYFIDSIHLSTKAIPLYIEEFKKIEFIDKNLLNLSLKATFPDLLIQTLKRKTLSFWLQHTTFYPTAQKCIQFTRSFFQ